MAVQSETLLRLPEVERRTGLRRAHLYKLAPAGTFPRPIKVGARASAWRETQVTAWITARISGGRVTDAQVSAPASSSRRATRSAAQESTDRES
jgi:prophage regulatory protein